MVQRLVEIRSCDLCGAEDGGKCGAVVTHTLTIDGHTVEFEAGDKCWDKKVLRALTPLQTNGRKPQRRPRNPAISTS